MQVFGKHVLSRKHHPDAMDFVASKRVRSRVRPGPLAVKLEVLLFGTACAVDAGDVYV